MIRRAGATGILLAIVLAFGWLPPLNDAVYPPPEASQYVSGPVESNPADRALSSVPLGGASPTPTALVVPTAEPAIPASPGDASVSGIASWYRYRPGEAAAGPALRGGNWRGSVVTVCGRACADVVLTDWCQCYGTRIIDLDARAFEEVCGALSKGLCRVTIRG